MVHLFHLELMGLHTFLELITQIIEEKEQTEEAARHCEGDYCPFNLTGATPPDDGKAWFPEI